VDKLAVVLQDKPELCAFDREIRRNEGHINALNGDFGASGSNTRKIRWSLWRINTIGV
jgi:hypothetical protein